MNLNIKNKQNIKKHELKNYKSLKYAIFFFKFLNKSLSKFCLV